MATDTSFDALLYASAPHAGKAELDAIQTDATSEHLTEREIGQLKKQLHRKTRYTEPHRPYHPVLESLKRFAGIVLIVLSIGFISVLSIEAVRTELWKFILDWSREYIHIQIEPPKSETVVPNIILEYREPRVLGEGYVRYEDTRSEYKYSLEYEYSDKLLSYEQTIVSLGAFYTSNEETMITEVTIGNYPGLMAVHTYNDMPIISLTWNDGEYAYYLMGQNFTETQLLEIAESIQ